jgi:hypothetical protein
VLMQSDIDEFVHELLWHVDPQMKPKNLADRITEYELRALLCKMGVHDYEFVSVSRDGALLRCFYCEHGELQLLRSGSK